MKTGIEGHNLGESQMVKNTVDKTNTSGVWGFRSAA